MLVRGATVAVLKDFTDVTNKIEYILGDLLKMPPLKFFLSCYGFWHFAFVTALLPFFVF